jgi:hypothetical protein
MQASPPVTAAASVMAAVAGEGRGMSWSPLTLVAERDRA